MQTPILAAWQTIDSAPLGEAVIGGWYLDLHYPCCRVVQSRVNKWPKRIEFYDGKKRVFPTHWLSIGSHIEPISSAPAAGKIIGLRNVGTPHLEVAVVEVTEWNRPNDKRYFDGNKEFYPTHWMPLPELNSKD